ncbi:CrcB protein [Fulvivirga imtechensis AK7]|uniref:Fluoride-specific ion channel FluC n=1 Tax=Fulvivirga imtechensis AK7 TaxID=1237149 RepID=L8JLF3_9BACT|nr:fluoride efflux transporter CrcB [Fulvivirga imtechensis]ELR69083.1 CrcB protein [Fulvivirga imtechensis AK7]
MIKNILLVGVGGFMGSIARYLVYLVVGKRLVSIFPWGTLIVNVGGSLILGIFMGIMIKTTMINDNIRLLIAVGFCGSFTTFSTFAYENMFLYQQKALPTALGYTFASLVIAIAAIFGGYFIGRSL